MKKSILSAALILILLVPAFAKQKKIPPSVNLTDADVIAFAEHCVDIMDDIEDAGVEEVNDECTKAEKEAVEKILEKYGISGPNRYDKLESIILSYSKCKLEKEMKDSSWFLQLTMAKKIKKLFDEKINPDDEAVVAKHLKLLDEKFGPILEEGDY